MNPGKTSSPNVRRNGTNPHEAAKIAAGRMGHPVSEQKPGQM